MARKRYSDEDVGEKELSAKEDCCRTGTRQADPEREPELFKAPLKQRWPDG